MSYEISYISYISYSTVHLIFLMNTDVISTLVDLFFVASTEPEIVFGMLN
jgi:hypothetical protein